MDKKSFRREAAKKRDALPKKIRYKRSLAIGERLFNDSCYKVCESVFCYLSFRSEAETEIIINTALREGKIAALPYMTEKKGKMVFVKIKSLSELVKNTFGIFEPVPTEKSIVTPTDKTIIIVPGTAFSRDNFRMGYGGGYYDRYLRKHCFLCTIGIGFKEQLYDEIPADEYDVRLDKLIIE
ncbi:MAG: 5-formyltetrahydrofolate cyclo-ligase [Clostridiales bacterium]|nr:5-formyltetrahydrofolate cyclo-ligase [Clostridiales bacterium]